LIVMVESRWLRWIGPGLIALGAVGSIAATTLGAGHARPAAFEPCDGVMDGLRPIDSTDAAVVERAWFALDPRVDAAGSLVGQRLTIGSVDGSPTTLDLPAESFAAGPFGMTVLLGTDDGVRSQLDLLDVAASCRWSLDSSAEIIRRATIDRRRGAVIELRLDRASRADLGIWAIRSEVGRPAGKVLDAIRPDPRFGRTWSTEFTWDMDGERLAIQSCGETACRTRVIGSDPGATQMLDQPDLGLIVGLDGNRLVTYQACRGLPCPLIATDLATGVREVLIDDAGTTMMVGPSGNAHLVMEVESADGRALRSVSLDGTVSTDLGPIPSGMHLVPRPGSPDPAAVWLAADQPSSDADVRPPLRHIPDGAPVPHDEVAR
jgi:hypothetical protein